MLWRIHLSVGCTIHSTRGGRKLFEKPTHNNGKKKEWEKKFKLPGIIAFLHARKWNGKHPIKIGTLNAKGTSLEYGSCHIYPPSFNDVFLKVY
jgi:hypothetical protein